MLKKSILSLSLVIPLSACNTLDTKAGMQSLQGCAAGGLVGGLIGGLTGNRDGKRILIGAVAGCAAGALIGYKIGKRTDHYANEKNAVEGEIIATRKEINDIRDYNKKIIAKIDTLKQDIADLRGQNLDYQMKKSKLAKISEHHKKEIADLKINIEDTKYNIQLSKKILRKSQNKQIDSQKTHELQQQIAQLEAELKEMQSGYTQYKTAMIASM